MFITQRNFRQILVCLPILCQRIVSGTGWGWTPNALLKLRSSESRITTTYEQASWIASIGEGGRLAGPLIAPLILDKIGRKYALIIAATSYLLQWPTLFFLQDVRFILLARVIFGMTDGFFDVVSSIYITENCSTRMREIIGCAMNIIFQAGFFIELIIGTYLSYDETILVNGAISICAYVTICLCIETPSFSLMKNKYDDAKKNLQWLNIDLTPDQLVSELEKLKKTVQEEKQKRESWKTLLRSKDNATSLFIVLSLFAIIAATGNSAINPHSTLIFSATETLKSNHFSILYSLVNFASANMVFFVTPNINRRTLFIACFSIQALCHIFIAVLMHARSKGYNSSFQPWLVYLFISIFGTARAMYMPVQFVLRSELLPLSVRAIGGSCAIILSSVTGFCTTKMFMPITKHLGMEINFLVFATMCILVVTLIYYHLPETRGKSLEEIQNELKAATKADCCNNEETQSSNV